MAKSKIETLKDALTASNGMIENVTHLCDLCESELGQDYGLHQVRSLLVLTARDLSEELYILEYHKT